MKIFLTVVGLPSLVVAAALLGSAQSSSAQAIQSKFSRLTPQFILAQGQPDSSITPAGSTTSAGGSTSAAPKLPANYGLVRSMANGMVEVRSLDGTSKQLTIPSALTSSASGLQPGALVGFDTDASGGLTRIEPATVGREVQGTISSINGDQMTLLTSSGETFTTAVNTATIARLGLVPNMELKVTTYAGTWATKICCVETPAPISTIPIVPAPTPMPQGGGMPVPPVPIRGLW
jgi:hypothetical protein